MDQLKIEDPYEKLNDPSKLAFVCSLCQTLVAGESATVRFEQHQSDCNAAAASSLNDDLLVIPPSTQTESADNQLFQWSIFYADDDTAAAAATTSVALAKMISARFVYCI